MRCCVGSSVVTTLMVSVVAIVVGGAPVLRSFTCSSTRSNSRSCSRVVELRFGSMGDCGGIVEGARAGICNTGLTILVVLLVVRATAIRIPLCEFSSEPLSISQTSIPPNSFFNSFGFPCKAAASNALILLRITVSFTNDI